MSDKTPYGISYPIQRGETGYFKPTYDSVESAKNNIINFLLTKPGSRPGRPEYGSGFWNLLFEQNNVDIEDIASEIITEDIRIWLPEILVESVEVERSFENVDIYRLRIRVNFRLTQNSNLESVDLTITA